MAYKLYRPKPVGGFYPQTKVYSDGSHYIAIPHTERPYRPKRRSVEEIITVRDTPTQETPTEETESGAVTDSVIAPIPLENNTPEEVSGKRRNSRRSSKKALKSNVN